MIIEQWLEDAKSDAYRRKLPELAELMEGLAAATAVLRAADWNDDASGDTHLAPDDDRHPTNDHPSPTNDERSATDDRRR